jgi:flagellar basal-body rod modification protein FlgD
MTSPITATDPSMMYQYAAAATNTSGTTATSPTGVVGTDGTTNTQNTQTDALPDSIEDDKDLFLKLLIAQMKNQDPDNPTDSSQYLSQMASFTEVEKLGTIADAQASMLTATQMSSAVTMLGDTVTYGAGDDSASGKVTGVTVIDGVPQLLVGTTKVPLTSVTGVAPAGATAISPDSDSSGSSSSAGLTT